MISSIIRKQAWQWMIIISLLGIFTLSVEAAVPDNVDYQGYLTDSGGSPINGTVSVIFTLYNIDTGGIALWSDTQAVNVTNGLFTVKLGGSGAPFPIGLFDAPLWLGIDVASDGEMAPRIAFSSSAFTHKADDALTLDGIPATGLASSIHTHTGEDITSGILNLEGSTTGPLEYIIRGSNTGNGVGVTGISSGRAGIYGESSSGTGAGVMGWHTGLGYGVWGEGGIYGVYGSSKNTAGYGVYGVSEGIGVYGRSDNTYAGYFEGDVQTTGDMVVDGNVGIGTASPTEKLSVLGIVESTSGGFRFPDGSVQTTSNSAHVSDPSAHHTKTTNAAELTSGLIPNARIASNAITTARLDTGAVTAVKLSPNAVTTTKIDNGAVTSAKLAPGLIQSILGLEVITNTQSIGTVGGPPTREVVNLSCPAGKTAISCGFITDQNLWHIEAAIPIGDHCSYGLTTCIYQEGAYFVCPYGAGTISLTATCVNNSAL